jgi:2',3'-cyclic-nucleotide 2'-phosphodiesterase (5'-nucleotidase family)
MLLLDSGNFSDNPTPEGEIKTRALLEAMELLGYEVVNVGERDIRMGYADFARRTAGMPFKFISANVVDRKTQKPIFEPHAVVDVKAPQGDRTVKVGVIGVVRYNPIFMKSGPEGTNMVIAHPAERVRKEVESLQSKNVDAIVLLAALHKDDAKRIVTEVEGIDYVLGSYGGQITTVDEKVENTSVLYCGNRGQRIGVKRVFFSDDSETGMTATTKMHMLTKQYPADQEMLDWVNAIRLNGAGSPENAAPAGGSAGASGP